MILAVVGIVHEYELLPYYLDHYRELGVERFIVACIPADLDSSGALARMIASQADVEVIPLPRGFQRSNLVGMIEEEIRSRSTTAGDWVIPADLDELNRYPGDLGEIVERMEDAGCTHLTGTLRDRLAPDGMLAKLQRFGSSGTIWEQYPLEADVTSRITQGSIDKVLLSRGDLPWTIGHHRMRESPELRPFNSTGVAHHFKWRNNLDKTLAWRVQNEERARVPWSQESVRLRDYLRKHGRIVPEDVGAIVGWRPQSSARRSAL